MRGTGTGKLNLKLTLPIEEMAKLKVNGQYQFINTELRLDEGLPAVSKINGQIDFSEKGITLKNLRGEAVGGPFTLSGSTRPDGVIALTAAGTFSAAGLRTWLTEPWFARLSGSAPWRAAINLRKKTPEITLDSTLVGVAIDLPAPFAKAAADPMPLHVVKTSLPVRGEDELALTLDRIASLRLQRRPEGKGTAVVRGAIGVGEPVPALPRAGLAINVVAARVDVDDWKRRVFDTPAGPPAAGAAPGLGVASLNLRADTVSAYGRTLNQVRLTGSQEAGAWALNVNSREVTGDLNFRPAASGVQGRLIARLRNLIIPQGDVSQVDAAFDRAADDLPAIDIAADNFELGNKKLGKLALIANNEGGEWAIQKVSLENPDGALNGSGAWRVRQRGEARRRIDLAFNLDTHDAGKLLERLGFPGTLRGGAGKLSGNIGWDGSPLSIDYPSLRGSLDLRAEKGQFLKVEPGVGKLLGIMSLQALPRRLTLDFRDVFSEGFAFDLVSASSKVERGVLTTTDFKMTSVSAVVLMSGNVDLARETQDLKVVVLPDLSGGMGSVLAIIAGVNPIFSLATYLAQRVLKDPISKAFSFEYAVSGTWADPKIARIQLPKATGGSGAPGGGAGGNDTGAQGARPAEPPGGTQNPQGGG